jgi:7-cyano-7-deazaguanine reductase
VHEALGAFSFILKCVVEYTDQHAASGISAELPDLECWPNQFPGYEISISMPEFTSICPKTGLPDFGNITIKYRPDKRCLELKSLKNYFQSYRNLGIFYENAVNRILRDVVQACQPVSAKVIGEFNTRGGMRSVIEAQYSAPSTPSTPSSNR